MISPESYSLDCSGHLCPVPILMTEEKIAEMAASAVLEVVFTDPGAKADLIAWCRANGHEWLSFKEEKPRYRAQIKKNP